MKTKIKGKNYEIKIAPRELTAVFFSYGEEIKDTDDAFMLFNCPVPTSKKELDEIKKKAIEKAENQFDDFKNYLECQKALHERKEK